MVSFHDRQKTKPPMITRDSTIIQPRISLQDIPDDVMTTSQINSLSDPNFNNQVQIHNLVSMFGKNFRPNKKKAESRITDSNQYQHEYLKSIKTQNNSLTFLPPATFSGIKFSEQSFSV